MKRSRHRITMRRLRLMRLNGLKGWAMTGNAGNSKLNAEVSAMIHQPDWRIHLWLAWDSFWYEHDNGKEIK